VNKGMSEEDIRLNASVRGRSLQDAAKKSTNIMKRALMPKGLCLNPLAARNILPRSKAGASLSKRKGNVLMQMLVPVIPLKACLEVAPLLERLVDRRAFKNIGGLGDRPGDVFNAVKSDTMTSSSSSSSHVVKLDVSFVGLCVYVSRLCVRVYVCMCVHMRVCLLTYFLMY
jgi:hypothetical protein